MRLCDGRFFPMNSPANATPVQMCNVMCPASDTKVFYGGTDIGTATDPKGLRYSSLANAFAYRKAVVPGCTCNGKDAFGLAPFDINADPTLRTGDLVATEDGLKAFHITKGEARKEFTPIQLAPDTAANRERLSGLR